MDQKFKDKASAALRGKHGLGEVLSIAKESLANQELSLDDLDGVAGGVVNETNSWFLQWAVLDAKSEGISKETIYAQLAGAIAESETQDYIGATEAEARSLIDEYWAMDFDALEQLWQAGQPSWL